MIQPSPPLGRRALGALGASVAATSALAAPAEIRFRVMREGTAIGTHRVTFAEAAGELTARTEVAIAVRLVGITVFRLEHRFEEVWGGGRFRRAASRHDRNGTVKEFTARAEGDAILVTGGAGPLRLPGNAVPLSWWTPEYFSRPQFDTEDGHLLRLDFARLPQPDGNILWRAGGEEAGSEGLYRPDGVWLAWTAKAEDGSTVTYVRM